MIKISDYLDYLFSEVVQARRRADESAVQTAKEYAANEYLKHFRAPRFVMPSVKLDLPLKISKVDSNIKYELNINDKQTYLDKVNADLLEINKTKNLTIPPITLDQLNSGEFDAVIKDTNNLDNIYLRDEIDFLNTIDLKPVIEHPEIIKKFSTADNDEDKEVLSQILRKNLKPYIDPVSVKLDKIFIDPSPKKVDGEEKMLIKMNVDMVQEGIQINYVEDENGKKFEKVTID